MVAMLISGYKIGGFMINKYTPFLVTAILFGIIGFFTCMYTSRDTVQPPTFREEVRTSASDVQPARVPYDKPTMSKPTTPKGSKPVGTVELVVQGPKPVLKHKAELLKPTITEEATGDTIPKASCPDVDAFICPPVKLRVDWVEEDHQFIVAVKSDNGEILESKYIPTKMMVLPRSKRISALISDGDYILTGSKDFGAWHVSVGAWTIDDKPGFGVGGGYSW